MRNIMKRSALILAIGTLVALPAFGQTRTNTQERPRDDAMDLRALENVRARLSELGDKPSPKAIEAIDHRIAVLLKLESEETKVEEKQAREELREDRRDVRGDRREIAQNGVKGSRTVAEARNELREDRRELAKQQVQAMSKEEVTSRFQELRGRQDAESVAARADLVDRLIQLAQKEKGESR